MTRSAVPPLPDTIPTHRPFLVHEVLGHGITRHQLAVWWQHGLLRRPVRGVMSRADQPDTLESRVDALSLVAPAGAVITDRTAAWVHGVALLPRTPDRLAVPDIQCFSQQRSRLRRRQVQSGTRELSPSDTVLLGGLWVTTPLRTAMDLGRLLRPPDALAGLDGFNRLGVGVDRMLQETPRFKGMRGVVQLRTLVPLTDGRSESPAESALRLEWIDAALPPPVPQCPVEVAGRRFRLDIGDPRTLFAAEYDGEDFHGEDRREHDEQRRLLLARAGWRVVVFTKEDLYQRGGAGERLQREYQAWLAHRRGLSG